MRLIHFFVILLYVLLILMVLIIRPTDKIPKGYKIVKDGNWEFLVDTTTDNSYVRKVDSASNHNVDSVLDILYKVLRKENLLQSNESFLFEDYNQLDSSYTFSQGVDLPDKFAILTHWQVYPYSHLIINKISLEEIRY